MRIFSNNAFIGNNRNLTEFYSGKRKKNIRKTVNFQLYTSRL